MTPSLTCYGGIGEIGGNKFFLEDRGVRVILDFGTGFTEGSDFFDSNISPRNVNGAGDLFEFGLLPEISGLYSDRALQNTELKYAEPEFDAIVLSHYHWDHMGRIVHIDPKIPVYCGETTALIHEASAASTGSPLVGHSIRRFRTGDKFRVGPIEFVPVHVDHSIPGAYGFVIHTSEGTLIYTGDFRFHGPAGSMTNDFVNTASQDGPAVLLTEGTRVAPGGRGTNISEKGVFGEACRVVKDAKGLVFSTFRGNDVDRINTFYEASRMSERRLVVSMKTAALLERLKADKKLKVPRVGKDVDVYLRRKKSGNLDDKDYYTWERPFLDFGVGASDVRSKQAETFLHLESINFPELIDIRPHAGGTYIHAATEAFNEEGEREESVIRNWIDHVGFTYEQLHASGHAPMSEVEDLVKRISPSRVIPIHTEHPRLFGRLRGGKWKVELPKKGVLIPLSS